jgi:hypothetical protein
LGYIGRTPTGSILTGADIADGSISTAKLADTAVSTAKIADDAVGNTKLNLASDYAFTGTISGTPQGLTLLSTQSSSSSVSSITVDNVFTATYDNYMLLGSVKLGTSGGYYLRLLKSDGSERISTYYTADLRHDMNSGAIADGGSSINVSTFYIGRGGGASFSSASKPTHHEIRFLNPFTSTICTTMFNNSWGYHDSLNHRCQFISSSRNENAETHRGFKFVANSGDFTSHNFKVYGVTNA